MFVDTQKGAQCALGDRDKTGRYDYAVPGPMAGSLPTVAGDRGQEQGRSTLRLGSDPDLLDRVRRSWGRPWKSTSSDNPYDNIATMYQRREPLSIIVSITLLVVPDRE